MQVDAEPADVGDPEGGVDDVGVAVDPPRVRRQRGQHRLFDVDAVERALGERLNAPVHPHRRRRAGDEQQVAAVARREHPQPALEPGRVPGARGGVSGRVQLEDQAIDVVGIGHEVPGT